MRLYSIVLTIPAVVYLSRVDSVSAADTTKAFTHSRSAVVDHQNTNQRYLRAYATTVKNGEERVFEALLNAAKAYKTNTKLNAFLSKMDDGVGVLNSLKLGNDVVSALTRKKLTQLTTYIAMFNENNLDKTISLIGVLTARYGDDAVAKSLAYLEKYAESPQVVELAKQLRKDQLSSWLNDGKSVDHVFQLLKLGDEGVTVFANRKFTVLEDYITKFNSETNGHATLLNTLLKGFDGESNLVTILSHAKRDLATEQLARKLEKELLGQWLQRDLEPEKVMMLLNLDNHVDVVLKSENLRTFEKYIAEFNGKNSNSQLSLLGMLTEKFGEVGVAKAIVSAKENSNSAWVANKLQKQQLQGWLDNGMTVDDLFTHLKLKADDTAVFGRSLNTLDDYVKLYNTATAKKDTLMGVLLRGFGGESALANKLSQARVYTATHAKATKLLTMQFQKWKSGGLNPTNLVAKLSEKAEDGAPKLKKTVVNEFKKFHDGKELQ
ncbi:hypothetical protein L917_17695 [Phytophthora nicotianae]|uniref:RxLR effector protein n=1 Tax=Phytophthora nicotianae TaxID=4792 RepID=W2KAB8_PHYNI|nr:hypothetical protein L917_17695 [Phytophthora nicotianae]